MILEDLLKKKNKQQDLEIEKAIDRIATDIEAAGYPTKELQKEIYSWVSRYLPEDCKSIIDIGAGRGDFVNELTNECEYFGFELANGLVQAGIKLHGSRENFHLVNEDYLSNAFRDIADASVCIGSLNSPVPEDKWTYFNKVLNKSISDSKCCIFVLNTIEEEGLENYPIENLINMILHDKNYIIDNSKGGDIYLLKIIS